MILMMSDRFSSNVLNTSTLLTEAASFVIRGIHTSVSTIMMFDYNCAFEPFRHAILTKLVQDETDM